jgi:thioredoxin 1
MVRKITDASEIPRDRKVAIDFFATWCGPCRVIGPKFEELEEMFPSILFLKADIDEIGDVEGLPVETLPTFYFLDAAGKAVGFVKGADFNGILGALTYLEKL